MMNPESLKYKLERMTTSTSRLGGLKNIGPSKDRTYASKNPMMGKFGQAMREKFLSKLQSFVSKKDRREKGLSSCSGSSASPDDEAEISSIEIDHASPDKIIVNKEASQEDILNMVDT